MESSTWAPGEFPWLAGVDVAGPSIRVIIDNDFAGDPDDLFQVAHHLMSPAVEVRGIVASHLAPGDSFDPGPHSVRHGVEKLRDLFAAMGFDGAELIWPGSADALVSDSAPQESDAARAVVIEAMRDDPRPLYFCAGGGLTDIASAWLIEPRIAEHLTLIWIGGPEYAGPVSPGLGNPEYNLAIDVRAAQVVFNRSNLPMWQVPRDVYRQCLVSDIELRRRVGEQGRLGAFLLEAVRAVTRMMSDANSPFWAGGSRGFAGTYVLGDSPLVLLSALQSAFQPDASSSEFTVVPAPCLDDDGAYVPNPAGRPIRVYTRLDTRLMFEDLFGHLAAVARWRGAHDCG